MKILRRTCGIVCALLLLAAAGCGGGPIRLGVLLPESGPAAPYAEEVRRGIDLAVQAAPMAGERPIELVSADTQGRPVQAGEALKDLAANQKIFSAIGGATEAEMKGLAHAVDEVQMILLSPTATGDEAISSSEWVFSLWPSRGLESTKLATTARASGVKYLALAWAKGPYGEGFRDEFVRTFKGQRGEVIAEPSFARGMNADAAGKLAEELAGVKPDAVLVASPVFSDVVALLGPLREAGFTGRVLTTSTFTHPAALEAAGQLANGLIYSTPYLDLEATEASRKFADAYRKAYNAEPSIWAAYGYDAATVLIASLAKESDYATDTLSEFRRTAGFQGAAGEITFDQQGKVVRVISLFLVQDGKPVPYAAGE